MSQNINIVYMYLYIDFLYIICYSINIMKIHRFFGMNYEQNNSVITEGVFARTIYVTYLL